MKHFGAMQLCGGVGEHCEGSTFCAVPPHGGVMGPAQPTVVAQSQGGVGGQAMMAAGSTSSAPLQSKS